MTITLNSQALDHGPQADAQAQLAAAVATLGYDSGLHQMLERPRREMTVSVPLRRDDASVEILTGHRVQHNFSRGPANAHREDLPLSRQASATSREAIQGCLWRCSKKAGQTP